MTRFKPGDRVFGFHDFGSHAEYTTIPEGFTYAEAAPLTEGAHYALNYIEEVDIGSGTRVLINGATGAIGSAALQIVKSMGAEVTATCDTENIEFIKSLGSDRVIDYTEEDFTGLSERFHFVFDSVGKSSFERCKSLLMKGGFYASTELGPMSQNPFLAIFTRFAGDKRVLFPIPAIDKEKVNCLRDMAEKGQFKPVIDRTYAFGQIPEAFAYVTKGQKTGNVVINVD